MTASNLERKIAAGSFVVTAEIAPPRGGDAADFLRKGRMLRELVDAVNVTDNQGARMRVSPLAAAALLLREGIEPVMQLTCRDRNRMALQSDLLGAAALGVRNVLALTGDHMRFGDHGASKQVFDMDSVQLLRTVETLNAGKDLAGAPLDSPVRLFAGAAAAPAADPPEPALLKVEKKVRAGARFLQTQAIFDLDRFRSFAERVQPLGVAVIGGIFILRSAGMAKFINRNIPGLTIPDEVVRELETAADPAAAGLDIARRTAAACREMCGGIHIMAMGREETVPLLLDGLL